MDAGESDDKPVVFAFTLGSDWHQSQFQSRHSLLLNVVFSKSNLRHARTARQALALFVEHRHPQAVFVADPAIMMTRNEVVSQKLVQYASDGGVVIFGGVFGTLTDRVLLDGFFARTWNVPWRAGVVEGEEDQNHHEEHDWEENHRPRHRHRHQPQDEDEGYAQQRRQQHTRTIVLNPAAVEPRLRAFLCASYRQTGGLFLRGVDREVSWYLPDPEGDPAESCVAFAAFGDGNIGFIGDVNGEQETNVALLAMMGLL